jgi:hypothetical protein
MNLLEDFTQHELHLNAADMTKVAKLMSQNVSLSEIRKKHPIILKWNTTFNDPSTVNNISKVMNQEYVVIGNEGRNEYQIDSINYGIKTSSLASTIPKVMKEEHVIIDNEERNEDQTDFKNQRIRVSTRPKRFPNTRSDDYYGYKI